MKELLNLWHDLVNLGLEKFGLFYSQYRGFVYDNEDPLGYSRLKVSVPEIFGDNILDYWAWPSSNFSGKGYGLQCLPQRNDLIWVRFEKGNPRKPIWCYGYFGKDEKPESLKNPKNYWFKTPAGHIIELDDSANAITITSNQGGVITMDDSGITIDAGESPIFIGGDKQVLYSLIPNSTNIADVSQIGVSQKIKVGI